MADFNSVATGGFTLGGVSNAGLKTAHYTSFGGMILSGTVSAEPILVLSQDFTWNIESSIEFELSVQWDLGEQVLHYYTVYGECQKPPTCEVTGIDPNDVNCASGGGRFMQTVAARSLSDLCTKLKTLLLTYPLNWPISKIVRHSRPVYLSDVNFIADENTKISRLSDGTTITVIIQPTQTVIITRLPNGVASSTTVPVTTGVVNDVLPDGSFVTTTIQNGIVNSVLIKKPDGTVNVQKGNSITVATSDSARDVTVSNQLNAQLSGLPEACNRLEEQVFCHIPECLEFCVSEYHIVKFSANSFFQDAFYNYTSTGGFNLDGSTSPTSPLRIGSGGFTFSGSALTSSSSYSVNMDGGLTLEGQSLVSSDYWSYIGSGGLIISSETSFISPTHHYEANGGFILGSGSIYDLNLNYMSSGGLRISSSSTLGGIFYNYKHIGNGGVLLSGINSASSNIFSYITSGGLVLNGQARIKSPVWHYSSSGGLSISGGSLIKLYYQPIGGLNVSGSANQILKLRYVPVDGLIFNASYTVSSSPSYHYVGSGGFNLNSNAITSYNNLGDYLVNIVAEAELLLMEAVFPSVDINLPTLTADTGTVIGNCGCNPVPIKLKMKHNLGTAVILKEFLFRNNLSLSEIINLTYNKYDETWRATYHFKGISAESVDEKWILIFEFGCSYPAQETDSKIWRISILVSRIKSNNERYDTRVLYSFKPTDICNDNEIKFSFIVNTKTEQLTFPNDVFVAEAVLSDEIGLFESKTWKKTNKLQIEVAETGLLNNTKTKDISSIFPE